MNRIRLRQWIELERMIERSKNEELSELERWIGQIEKEGVKKERRKSE